MSTTATAGGSDDDRLLEEENPVISNVAEEDQLTLRSLIATYFLATQAENYVRAGRIAELGRGEFGQEA